MFRGIHNTSNGPVPVAVKVFQDTRDRDAEVKILDMIADIPGVIHRVNASFKDGIVLELL